MDLLAVVETLETGGESVAGLVHQVDRMVEALGAHHAQQRSEELRYMGEASGQDPPLDPGRPQRGVVADAAGPQRPGLARLELVEPLACDVLWLSRSLRLCARSAPPSASQSQSMFPDTH